MVRRASADYLEEATLEELAADLERQGYRVAREARLGDEHVDLLAERDGERLAFEVKARSRLKETSQDVVRLRDAARAAGVTGLRLVVAMPPHAVDVTIENLEAKLLGYLAEHETPRELEALSTGTRFEGLADIDIESVNIDRSGIHVRGRGIAEVELDLGEGHARDALTVSDDLPFTFDLDLDADLQIARMNRLDFDTNALAG